MTEAMPFLQNYDITFLRPPSIGRDILFTRKDRRPAARLPFLIWERGRIVKRGGQPASTLPNSRQAASAASSGASQQVTLSQAREIPALPQSFSQSRIHWPSPQP